MQCFFKGICLLCFGFGSALSLPPLHLGQRLENGTWGQSHEGMEWTSSSGGVLQGGDLLDWTSDVGIQEDAFIQRIEALSTMGYSVLISNMQRYFECAAYLSTFTRESIVIALGVPSLQAWD